MTEVLEHLRQSKFPVDELGSTLLLLCLDRGTGRYISIHLGDGSASYLRDNRINRLSSPENGITSQYTVLTSSKNCIAKTRVHRGEAKHTAFLLATDGCHQHIWNGIYPSEKTESILLRLDWAGFEKYMHSKKEADDYSFIAIEP